MGGLEQNSEKMLTFCFGYGLTEGPMEGPRDRLTDGPTSQVLESLTS